MLRNNASQPLYFLPLWTFFPICEHPIRACAPARALRGSSVVLIVVVVCLRWRHPRRLSQRSCSPCEVRRRRSERRYVPCALPAQHPILTHHARGTDDIVLLQLCGFVSHGYPGYPENWEPRRQPCAMRCPQRRPFPPSVATTSPVRRLLHLLEAHTAVVLLRQLLPSMRSAGACRPRRRFQKASARSTRGSCLRRMCPPRTFTVARWAPCP